MHNSDDLDSRIDRIIERDSRFKHGAYLFVMAALDHTLQHLDKPRHVSGAELLDGIREYGLQQFGRLCLTVFYNWGITETRHFGDIVFSLVEARLLSKTEEDSIEDFTDVFDLTEECGAPGPITVDHNRIRSFLQNKSS